MGERDIELSCSMTLETDVDRRGASPSARGNPMLAPAEMQAALDEMMEDGTYLEIAEEWVGGDILA